MKASILFITYQHEKFVAESIRSAMAQDHPDLELVICDDGSSDRTRRILEEEMASCPRHIGVIWASTEENRGFHANFNRGLAACSGDVIVAMSGDDISLQHRVSKICGVFSANPECMLVCSGWSRIDESGMDLGIREKHRKDAVFSYAAVADHVYAKAPVCGATGAYRASLRSLFPPMAEGRHGEDNCFWVRALLAGNIHYVSEPLVLWRSHQNNQFNRTCPANSEEAIRHHLRFLRSNQSIWRQWIRDLDHAQRTDLISRSACETLERTIWIQRESYRLLRYSVIPAPWTLWIGSASRLLGMQRTGPSIRKWVSRIVRRHLRLRFSAERRDALRRRHFRANT